ncbi:protein of unknown function (DUF3328) domain containing protein [Naviculisporaceae sp. PSN 640]
MATNTSAHDLDPERGSTSERGGLLEEIPITDSKKHSAIMRRLQEFDMDEDTKSRWKLFVVPGLCLFFGFIFGISAGVLLAGGTGAGGFASTSGSDSDDPPMCKLPSPHLSGPRFPPNMLIKFEPNATFANASSTDKGTDDAWAALNPLGKGFVSLDEHGDVILYNGTHNTAPTASTKVVSVFHQLHCLNHLRKSLAASAASPIEYSYLIPQLSRHWDHCFDYLRQSLMCSADITLESLQESSPMANGAKNKDGSGTPGRSASTSSMSTPLAGVDGWGTTHLCRDFGVVRTWAEYHRASDDAGID